MQIAIIMIKSNLYLWYFWRLKISDKLSQVERVEVKDVRLPQSLQRAMAAEAEAAREAKAKVFRNKK